jgi:F0F1-type ATP synthase membrane subunit b/b'
VNAARAQAEAAVREAKTQIQAEIEQAKKDLAADSDALANQIAETILKRGVAA